MPKTVSAALKTHLQGTYLTLAKCLKITLQKCQPRITAITKANPGAVTTRWDHGFVTGDSVRFKGIRGMTELNGLTRKVTVTGPRAFTIDSTDTSAFTAYTERGEAQRVLGFTSADQELTFENVDYEPTNAFSPSALKQASDLSVSNLNMQGIIDSDAIKHSDLISGKYDNAEVEFFMVNRESLGDGDMHFGPGRGNIGEVQEGRGMYEVEFRGLEHHLAQQAGHVYSQTCRADFGNDDHYMNRCYIKILPLIWAANTSYAVRAAGDAAIGDVVRITSGSNAFYFKVTVAGRSGPTEPTWPTTLGGTVAEVMPTYAITDVDPASNPQYFLIAGDHQAEFQAGDSVTVASSGGNDGTYTVDSTALTSAGDTEIHVSEAIPADPSDLGTIQNATTAPTWEAIRARCRWGLVHAVTSGEERFRFSINVNEPEQWYRFGRATFIDGELKGCSYEIKSSTFTSYGITDVNSALDTFTVAGDQTGFFLAGDQFTVSGSTGNDGTYTVVGSTLVGGDTEIEVSEAIPDGTADGNIKWAPTIIELFQDTPFNFAVGDEVEICAGCDKLLRTCIDTYDNVDNFRGEPYVPGPDKMLDTPVVKT